MVLKLVIVAVIAAVFIEIGCRLVFRQGLVATLWDILDSLDPRNAEARRLRQDKSGAGAMRQLIEKRRSTAAEVLRQTELVQTAAEVTEEVAEAEERLAKARARLRTVGDRKTQTLLERSDLPDPVVPDHDDVYRQAGSDPAASHDPKEQRTRDR